MVVSERCPGKNIFIETLLPDHAEKSCLRAASHKINDTSSFYSGCIEINDGFRKTQTSVHDPYAKVEVNRYLVVNHTAVL
jgi:hypothetical protein